MNSLVWLILTGVGLTILEIVLDSYLWKRKFNDKPYTTFVRLLIMAIIAGFIEGNLYLNFFLIFSTHFLLFDFSLNISRWKWLPDEKRKFHTFIVRFFYHGGPKTKSLYDRIFQRIPPQMELLIKGTVFGIAIYFV